MAVTRRAALLGIAVLVVVLIAAVGWQYLRLLRPSVLKQLNPDVVGLLNALPELDHQNEAIIARLFAHGGLSHADVGPDGVMHDRIIVAPNQFIWQPAIIVMPRAGELDLDFSNDDHNFHVAFMPSDGDRQVLQLPTKTGGRVRVSLGQPGLYWFGCPVSNHAGRGMLGLIVVAGEVPVEAKLDRPPQKRP
jgi:PQQ system protein